MLSFGFLAHLLSQHRLFIHTAIQEERQVGKTRMIFVNMFLKVEICHCFVSDIMVFLWFYNLTIGYLFKCLCQGRTPEFSGITLNTEGPHGTWYACHRVNIPIEI